MESLKNFKGSRGITEINFLKGQGRPFATVVTKTGAQLDIIISEKCDTKKDLFVTYMEEKNLYVVCNSGATEFMTL